MVQDYINKLRSQSGGSTGGSVAGILFSGKPLIDRLNEFATSFPTTAEAPTPPPIPEPETEQSRLSASQIQALLANGIIDPQEAMRRLVALGYSSADAQSLVSLTQAQNTPDAPSTPKIPTLSAGQIQSLLNDGSISAVTATERLRSMGYSEADVKALVTQATPESAAPATTPTASSSKTHVSADGQYLLDASGHIIGLLGNGGGGAAGGGAAGQGSQSTSTSNTVRNDISYVNVPTPEQFLDDFKNGFSTHLKNMVSSGHLGSTAAMWLSDNIDLFWGDYLGKLGQMAQAGQPVFKAVNLGSYPTGSSITQSQSQSGPGGAGGTSSATGTSTSTGTEQLVSRPAPGYVHTLSPLDYLGDAFPAPALEVLYEGRRGTRAAQNRVGGSTMAKRV